MGRPSFWERLFPSRHEVEAAEERAAAAKLDVTPIGDVDDRQFASMAGIIRTVTLRPLGGVVAAEAQLYDGTGSLDLVWLGQRKVGGIEPGRRVRVTGRVAFVDGQRTMFNPAYELRPRVGA